MTNNIIPENGHSSQAEIDLHQARKFLDLLSEDDQFTFQYFDDKKKNPALAGIKHGSLDALARELEELNAEGAGICVTINKTDLAGRSSANITKVQAVFVDLDGSPPEAVMNAPISAHIVVESSPGKFHFYWLVEDVPLDAFVIVQKQLAEKYGGDLKVCDLSRVMRLPGFLHQKKSPYMTRIVSTSAEQPVKFSTFVEAFGIDLATSKTQKSSHANNPILATLEARGMVVERKRNLQGCIVIKCPWAHLHSTEDKGTCYYEPYTNGYSGHGYKCFHSHCEDRTIEDLKNHLEISGDLQVRFIEEPLPLGQELLPVDPFTDDLLPDILRPWIVDCAERMQVPPDFLAAASIVVLGSLIGRKAGIHPKAFDDWLVIPNLWGAVVGRPSLLKSPAIFSVLEFLDPLIDASINKHQQDFADFQEEQLWVDAQKASQKEEFKNAARKAGTKVRPCLTPIDLPSDPVLKRYKTEDATTEKLGEILRDNPQGILLHRDELTGWLRSLEKSGREGDRAFFLESWTGTGSFTVDRIARGTLHIPALCLSIFGSIQPGPLSAYIDQATGGGGGDDGLLQRFQILVWPDVSKEWKNIDRAPDEAAYQKMLQIFRALDACVPFEPQVPGTLETQKFRFSSEAQTVFDGWRAGLEARLRGGELTPALESHLAKYRSLMPSLALIFYLMKTVGNDVDPVAVDKESAALAIKWCTYLESHARRLYASGESQGMESARALLAKIEAGDLVDEFSIRSVYHKRHWAHLETAGKVRNAVKVLEEHGWVILQKIANDGRPTEIVHIHPSLRRTV